MAELSDYREHIQDVRAWLVAVSADRQAALGAERITTTCRENEREPYRNILIP